LRVRRATLLFRWQEAALVRERRPALLDAEALWSYAVKALAGRAHSMGELREKLRRRAQRAADVDAAIARLKEDGYLNDRQFAESFAAARLENEGLGSTRVLADLARRRVAPAVARQTVTKVYEDIDEQALAEDFVRRKFRFKTNEHLFQEPKEMAAAYRRLRRAGFGSGTAMAVLKKFARDPALLDGVEPPAEPEADAG
jgi:regulatory protein